MNINTNSSAVAALIIALVLSNSAPAWASTPCTCRPAIINTANSSVITVTCGAGSAIPTTSTFYLCATDATVNTWNPVACKNAFALLTTAMVTGKTVQIQTSGSNCSATNFPNWGYYNPYAGYGVSIVN